MIKKLQKKVLNIVYPDNIACNSCGKDIDEFGTDSRYGLCKSCFEEVYFITGASCNRCGAPLYEQSHDTFCSSCQGRTTVTMGTVACFAYSGVGKKLIMDLKYNRKTYLSQSLADILADLLKATYINDIELIVPVPIHKTRLNERGFNQMALVGKRVSESIGIPCDLNGLIRLRRTQKMKTLGRIERRQSLEHVFECDSENIRGKNILLIDDIYTTGATIENCAKTLISGGALSVFCAVLAVNFQTDLYEKT